LVVVAALLFWSNLSSFIIPDDHALEQIARESHLTWKTRYNHIPGISKTYWDRWKAWRECGNGPDYVSFFSQDHRFRSSDRSNEDKVMYELFFRDLMTINGDTNAQNFTYLELGAFNGKSESNTRFYDLCLGWKGLLVEANPYTYQILVQNRPHAERLNFAPTCAVDSNPNTTVSFVAPPNVQTPVAAQVGTANAAEYANVVPVEVPCGSLTPVLRDYFGPVTFFSLDVEGAEPLVLQQLDLSQVVVDIFMVEHTNKYCKDKCESRDQTREILKNAGYHLFDKIVPRSDLFLRPASLFYEKALQKQAPV
jgi:FkbM family methyltransferase